MKVLLLFLLYVHLAANEAPEFCHVVLHPSSNVIIYVGDTIYFVCQDLSNGVNSSIQWFINDTAYNNETFSDIVITPTESSASYLRIKNTSVDMNNTEFSCSVQHQRSQCSSAKSKLQLQGHLEEISGLHIHFSLSCSTNGTISMNWTQPFTLISSSEDGIDYEVDIIVFNSTQILLLLDERISDTSFQSALPNFSSSTASCNPFYISIVPRNELGDGAPTVIVESLLTTEPVLITDVSVHADRNRFLFELQIHPAICDTKISLTDIYSGREIILPRENVLIINNCSYDSLVTITSTTAVQENQIYLATLFLTNSGGRTIGTRLSTFDAQHIRFDELNKVPISIEFLDNSLAIGALLLLTCPERGTIFFQALNREECKNLNIILSRNEAIIAAYDIEKNGKLISDNNMPAILPQSAVFSQYDFDSQCAASKPNKIKRCSSLSSIPFAVTLTCKCTESISITGYQVILLGDSLNETIYVNSGNCSMEATVHVQITGLYYVVVFPIDKRNGITEYASFFAGSVYISFFGNSNNSVSSLGYVLGVILPITAIIGAVIICFFLIKKMWNKKPRRREKELINERTQLRSPKKSDGATYLTNANLDFEYEKKSTGYTHSMDMVCYNLSPSHLDENHDSALSTKSSWPKDGNAIYEEKSTTTAL